MIFVYDKQLGLIRQTYLLYSGQKNTILDLNEIKTVTLFSAMTSLTERKSLTSGDEVYLEWLYHGLQN